MKPGNTTGKIGNVQLIDDCSAGFGSRSFKNWTIARTVRRHPEMFITWASLVAVGLWIFWLTSLKESESYWTNTGMSSYSSAALYWKPLILNAYYGLFWAHLWLTGAWVALFLKSSPQGKPPQSQVVWLSWFLVFLIGWNGLSMISDNLLEWITRT